MSNNTRKNRQLKEPISILMPISNEFERIESVIAEIMEVIFRHLPENSEFLIEEAGSIDGTKEILKELNQRWPVLNIVYKEKKEGFAKAARELYGKAKCPWVFFTDSDGQCVASEYWKLTKFMDSSDFITGHKTPRYDPFSRRVMSKTFNFVCRSLFKFQLKDINFGFRLCRRDAIIDCLNRCNYMPTLLNSEMIIIANSLGYKIHEVDVYHRPRLSGLSRGLIPGSILKESFLTFKAIIMMYRDMDKIISDGKNSDNSN